MTAWSADPATLKTASNTVKTLADQNNQSIDAFAAAMQVLWTQWSGDAATAAQMRFARWAAQARASQAQLASAAGVLLKLSEIYDGCHRDVQEEWKS